KGHDPVRTEALDQIAGRRTLVKSFFSFGANARQSEREVGSLDPGPRGEGLVFLEEHASCDRVSEQIGPTPDEGLGSARAQHIAVSRKGLDEQDQTAERQATEMLVGEEETGDGPRNSDGGACLGARLEHAKK